MTHDLDAREVEKIAESLTAAQREALLTLPRGYFDPNTVKALRRRGLLAAMSPTALGEKIKKHLQDRRS